MTRNEAQTIEESFAAIGPLTIEMGLAFYENLFETAPELRRFFPSDTDQQAMRLSQVLAIVVSNLRAPERLLPIIRALGKRHKDLGIAAEHFVPFKTALLKTLEERMATAWTDPVRAAWSSTFDMLAGEMLDS